jgi:very-short-patch-repair endonuclease
MDGTPTASDSERRGYIEALGWRVLRFDNHEVLADTSAVLEAILQALTDAGGSRQDYRRGN